MSGKDPSENDAKRQKVYDKAWWEGWWAGYDARVEQETKARNDAILAKAKLDITAQCVGSFATNGKGDLAPDDCYDPRDCGDM